MMQFTEQQLKAISSRSDETLVSAAAGSGKTRVLTQRIEALVRGADLANFAEDDGTQVNPEKMQDIRHMLIMTFTRAAASEMRARIVKALTDAANVQAAQHNEEAASRLRQQAEAAAGADISTVHRFCNRVIGEHYEMAGVCAGVGILSDEQASQLMAQSAREVFDECYVSTDKDHEAVQQLLRRYTADGRDDPLIREVIRIYGQMMGRADWEEWLRQSLNENEPQQMVDAWEKIRIEELERAVGCMELAAQMTLESPEAQAETPGTKDAKIRKKADADFRNAEKFREALGAARRDGASAGAEMLGKIRFSSTKGMPGMLGTAQDLREDARKSIKIFQSDEHSGADAVANIEKAHEDLKTIVNLVLRFRNRYDDKKRALNKVDYGDLEHKALAVLRELRRQGCGYNEYYQHVFVDEYQDTNQVQESILRELTGGNQVFMVGDLKQSIYGFRLADPEIFRSKDTAFENSTSGTQQRIQMNDNFRSSPAVIETVNALMGCLMRETLGGVEYEGREELVYGRGDGVKGHAQILIADISGGSDDGKSREVLEGEMIATRIAEICAAGTKPGDIAILTRSRSERVGALEKALELRGIPYFAQLDTNRTFPELDVFLNLLELIVNEHRDVPLLSVLRSYMFGFQEPDFARVVNWTDAQNAVHKKAEEGEEKHPEQPPFFQRIDWFREAGRKNELKDPKDIELAGRIEDFFAELEKLRIMGTDMSLSRFAEEVGAHFEFSSYLLTRPAGASRKKAYDMLLAAIAEQQELLGNSLYRVLKVVRRIREKGTLEAQTAAAESDAVRIMTIHASKGLEFPVVFLAASDRTFNPQSVRGDLLTSNRYGLALRYANEAEHIKGDTAEVAVVKRDIADVQKSEELRMLYVAMTRARDQLYLCGAAEDREKCENRWRGLAGRYETANSMLDWIMGGYFEASRKNEALGALYSGSFWRPGEPVGAGNASEEKTTGAQLAEFVEEAKEAREAPLCGLKERPRLPAAQGVSKRIQTERGREETGPGGLRPSYGSEVLRPIFGNDEDSTLAGAERGTLLHRALQYAVRMHIMPQEAVLKMRERQLITEKEAEELEKNLPELNAFFDSPLYARVSASDTVLTEQAFELLLDPPDPALYSGSRMRLRGMIDLCFLEDGEWVLVDYKSDRNADQKTLQERYAPQIGYYRKALRELTGRPVRASYLYSLEHKEAIPM